MQFMSTLTNLEHAMTTSRKASDATPKPVAAKKAAPKKATDKPVAVKATAGKSGTGKPAAAPAKAVSKAKPATPAKPSAARTVLKASTAPKPVLSVDQRNHYVSVAAFYIAERRGFTLGNPAADWLAAEAEIDRLIASGHFLA